MANNKELQAEIERLRGIIVAAWGNNSIVDLCGPLAKLSLEAEAIQEKKLPFQEADSSECGNCSHCDPPKFNFESY